MRIIIIRIPTEQIALEGYIGKDMRLYLQKLVQNERIREYDLLLKEKWSFYLLLLFRKQKAWILS